ncbi:MAG: efflux RND transporter periplasmic adaptor subunit [Planctomycetales bacterium]|nr:efflux RND transporter periplasmic adaptor subunit [Planctomycetales bacterium]
MNKLILYLKRFAKAIVVTLTVAGLAFLMAMLAGFFKPKVDVEPTRRPRMVPEGATTAVVEQITRPRLETAVGAVRALHEVTIASKLLARVVEVNVKAGQSVAEGEVLVRLDDADLTARLRQTQAAVSAAEAAHERAVTDLERARDLLERRAISQAEVDRIEAVAKTADAELQRAHRGVDEAQATLDFAVLKAPMEGVVIDKKVEVGDTAVPGQPLVTLYEPDRMQLVARVRETLANRLHVGDKIPAKLDVLDHACLATITEIVPEAETASRSFTVKVAGPCPPGIYSGMFGRISIPLDDETLIVVPDEAVLKVGQLEMVDVVVEGQLQRRHVRLGRRLDEGWEVLSGLAAGETVLLHSGVWQESHS